MLKTWIQNIQAVATTPERETVLKIVEAGYNAIDTKMVLQSSVQLNGKTLTVKGETFDLSRFKRLFVLAFGKASGRAALVLEHILGDKITAGVAIGITAAPTKIIQTFIGTHPLPSEQNVAIANKMAALIADITEDDLVINLISGGGSALLCWTDDEREQGVRLYQNYLRTGDDIKGLNTVRKHLSQVKGGGLAKMLYPATVISLIFSDVAGNNYHFVDSGPTYLDASTIADAQAIIDKYSLGKFFLTETPKDPKLFERVHNVPIVSNMIALEAMAQCAKDLDLESSILSAELFETADETLKKISTAAKPGTVILGGSEINLIVDKPGGKGGRNCYFGMKAFRYLGENDVVAAMASDGLDNSDCAGVILDTTSLYRATSMELPLQEYLANFDGYDFFEKLGHELIFTGPTEANVSDFIVWYKK